MSGIAIMTKFVPNTGRGSKVRASHPEDGSVTIDYDLRTGPGEEPYRKAAEAFCKKFKYTYDELVAGYMGRGAWVFIAVHHTKDTPAEKHLGYAADSITVEGGR